MPLLLRDRAYRLQPFLYDSEDMRRLETTYQVREEAEAESSPQPREGEVHPF